MTKTQALPRGRPVNALLTLVRTLGPARISAIGGLAAIVIGLAVFGYMRASTSPMRVLFTDLTFDDSTAIVRDLDGRGVDYELRSDGAVIMVPADQVLMLRMALAENGLPAGGAVGYEIFDSGDGLGATSFVQNLNHLRALEGELVALDPHHRPGAICAGSPGLAGEKAVRARSERAVGIDRAQAARHTLDRTDPRHSAPRRFSREGLEAEPGLGGR